MTQLATATELTVLDGKVGVNVVLSDSNDDGSQTPIEIFDRDYYVNSPATGGLATVQAELILRIQADIDVVKARNAAYVTPAANEAAVTAIHGGLNLTA